MITKRLALVLVLALVAGDAFAQTLYEGARLIPGDTSPVIERSAILIENGRISQVGQQGQVKAPGSVRRVDLTGKTVMPALVATHVHPGFQRGTTYVRENYSADTVVNDLRRALYFGVSVVQSQGIETGDVMYQVRADQQAGKLPGTPRLLVAGRGIGSPNAGPGGATYAGMAYEVTTEADSRRAVQELAARQVDIVKIWVDDRNRRAPKLPAPLYRAIIDEAHQRGLKVNAHVFYHVDAVDLVDAGIDGFAHLVRDTVMDDALVAAIVKRGVYVMGNLSSPRKSTYPSLPNWMAAGDPMMRLLSESVSTPVLDRLRAYFGARDQEQVEGARQRYRILEQSLAKLNRAGARLVLGADTGLEDHLFGMAEQLELEAMVDAGMSPEQGIVAATSRSAEYLGLKTKGALRAGLDADVIVLDANPLDAITNTRRISRVILGGVEIDRAALRKQIH
ncbi:MAG TPA: amidohydrolase family protein [Vicinamibacterales bacterium]